MRGARGFLLTAVAAVLLAGPDPAAGCSCVALGERAFLARADAVFSGDPLLVAPAGDAMEARFAVALVYKGAVFDGITVRTPTTTAACGIEFVVGERYLVFAREGGGSLQTGLCDGTTNDTAAPARLGVAGSNPEPSPAPSPIAAPAPAPGSRSGPIAAAALLLAAATLGLAGLGRRRPG